MNERISQIIATLGIKKIEFAKKIGISSPFVSELCTGAKKASDRTIADICREFNVNETWLRTGDGDMFNKIPDTLAGKLAKEYGLDDLGRQIMAAYLKLDENDRLAVGRLIRNLLDEQSALQAAAPTPTPAPIPAFTPPDYEAEAKAEAEAYYRELLEEKKRVAEDLASAELSDNTKLA